MATDATGTRSVHNTLSTTTVDTVTLQGHWAAVEVVNREVAGGADIWVTIGLATPPPSVPATPAAAANETFIVPAGSSLVIECPNGAVVQPQVKLLGSGNKYSVTGLPRAASNRAQVVTA